MRIGKSRAQADVERVLVELFDWSLKLLCFAGVWLIEAAAQSTTPLCQPVVGNLKTVVTAAQRKAAGNEAIPPITDLQFGFAWPDSEFGVFRTGADYTFFASDGAHHNENNKYGSVTRTFGTLDNPVGMKADLDEVSKCALPMQTSPLSDGL